MTIRHGNRPAMVVPARLGSSMARIGLRLLPMLVPAPLAACQQQVAQTSTSDRCTFAFIFDHLLAEWPPSLRDRVGGGSWSNFNVAVRPSARGGPVRLDIRGFYMVSGQSATASAIVSIAGRDYPIRLPNGRDTNDVFERIDALVPRDADTLTIGLRTQVSSTDTGTQAQLSIDSVDLTFGPNCASPTQTVRPPVMARLRQKPAETDREPTGRALRRRR